MTHSNSSASQRGTEGVPRSTNCASRSESGERVLIHGLSGCGKTTVLRLLAGFLAPGLGKILVGGQVVAGDGEMLVTPEHRQQGIVFQDLALWPHMTVGQNMDFGLRTQGLAPSVRHERISDMLERVHLKGLADTYPTRLSGDQQQRVGIARALVTRPLAVLMEEPLSNLDDELRDLLCAQVLDLHSQPGFTLVYVTHSTEEMRRIGTRAIRLRDDKEDRA